MDTNKKCDVCQKTSGKYSLCLDCFALMQQGKVKKCQNCGKWYLVGEICDCVSVSQEKNKTEVSIREKTQDDPSTTPPSNNEDLNYSGCLKAMLWTAVIIGLMMLLIWLVIEEPWESSKGKQDNTSLYTEITKTPPRVFLQNSDSITELKSVILMVEAKDDYDEVTIELCLYDEDKAIINTVYLTEMSLSKGQTYKLTYSMSWQEVFSAKSVSYRVYEYR